jgi:hypothetical protein
VSSLLQDVLIWLVVCVLGLVFSLLSLSMAWRIMTRVVSYTKIPEVAQETRHRYVMQWVWVAGWFVFLGLGVFALYYSLVLDPNADLPSGITPGMLIRWGLIAAISIFALGTVSDFLYTRKVWIANQLAASKR